MTNTINPSRSQFVAVASIAAELNAVMEVAKEISLAAANAKAIAFRAGEKARGFQPITDFINELAKETIELVNAINAHALLLYQITVTEYRMTIAGNHFHTARRLASGAIFEHSLDTPLSSVYQKTSEARKQFIWHVEALLDQLQEVMHPARAARVIAANSRIEASQAGEYLMSLQAVAESVDHAAQIINNNVQRCRSALNAIVHFQSSPSI